MSGPLQKQLVTPPVLAFPSFDTDFTLETDALIQGFRPNLSQPPSDAKPHLAANAIHALNKAEKNYSITELETFIFIHTSMATRSLFMQTTQLARPY